MAVPCRTAQGEHELALSAIHLSQLAYYLRPVGEHPDARLLAITADMPRRRHAPPGLQGTRGRRRPQHVAPD